VERRPLFDSHKLAGFGATLSAGGRADGTAASSSWRHQSLGSWSASPIVENLTDTAVSRFMKVSRSNTRVIAISAPIAGGRSPGGEVQVLSRPRRGRPRPWGWFN